MLILALIMFAHSGDLNKEMQFIQIFPEYQEVSLLCMTLKHLWTDYCFFVC